MQTLDAKARRNAAIADALRRRPVADVMRQYGLSRSQVYRIGKSQAERFAAEKPGKDGSMPTPSGAVVNLYSELGRSGLRRYGGTVDDDYDRAFRTLRARIALYREMGDDPIVAAVLQAIKMTLRRVSWYAEPDGDTDADKKAAEWLDTCMHDMSHNWTDVVDQALGMLQYGFYPAEIVYKPRRGDKTQTITADVNGKPVEIDLPTSKYDDGRIGWRKFCFLAPETLAPGSEWDFDDYGGLRGLNQQPPPDYPTIYIPIEKVVNFRTTAERGNPEGRALALDTPIPTPDGWTTMGALEVGSRVFDEQGMVRHVVARSEVWHDRPTYRVTFNDGTSIVADENHEWVTTKVWERSKRLPGVVRTTRQIAETVKDSTGTSNHGIAWAKPLQYSEQYQPIDAYMLGLWLGDGNSNAAVISTHVMDLEEELAVAEGAGYPVLRVFTNGSTTNARSYGLGGKLQTRLNGLGLLNNKHIPWQYQRGSIEQRLALLQGLMDSDGTVDQFGRCAFSNTNRKLIDGVAELVRSLGVGCVVAREHSRGREMKPHWHQSWDVKFTPSGIVEPFRLERKRARLLGIRARKQHYIVSVERIDPVPTVCIQVDSPSSLFLAGENMVPTHNSLLRPMWWSWYLKHNLEELEAIAAERYGAGFPVVYLGKDTTRNPEDPNSDLITFRDIVRNIRVDEMAGATIPYAKMGAGASEDSGALLEFVSPPGKGPVDFGQAIVRHEQRMTMVGLAQFIHLGMSETGSRALGQSATDFFTLAVSAWADALADTFQRYAVDRLFRLNNFPGLTAVPKIAHEAVAQTDIGMVADYINKLVGAQLLTPTEDLERYLLELADLPVSQKIAEIWEEKEKARQAGLDTAKNLAQQGPAAAQAQQGPAVAPNGAPPDKDSGETGDEAEEASALLADVEIDDMKANVFLAKFSAIADRFSAGQGAPESDLARELRRSNDLLEQSMRFGAQPTAAMPTIKFERGNVELPEGFGAQAAPVVNVDMGPVAAAFERFAEMAMPQAPAPNVTVTNTVDTGPIADALRQTPAPMVNVSVPPQAAPVVNVPPARVTAEVVMPDVTETARIERDENGLMTGVTKTRKARKG